MQNIYQKIGYVSVIVLLLSLKCNGQSDIGSKSSILCQQKTFHTQQTKCTIIFESCEGTHVNKFVKCTITNCQRHLGAQDCQRSLDFQLQEKACYRQCCKSDTFNQQQCKSVNTSLKQLHESQDNIIVLALMIISGTLVIFTLIFFFTVLKCNKETDNLLNEDKSNSLINWMDMKYFDIKCDICLSYGAIILTPCNHAYHEKCYLEVSKSQEINCSKCPQKMFSNVKIVCGECREKQFKVKVTKVSVLREIIAQGMIQHSVKCQKNSKELCTDIRLTSTGSSE